MVFRQEPDGEALIGFEPPMDWVATSFLLEQRP
jgi:hypothetical protein